MPYLKLLRPKQWTKNLLVFAAVMFTGNLANSDFMVRTLLAFVAMSLISSSVYVINDIRDIEKDRAHPIKKNRPLAAGQVTVAAAWGLALACFIVGAGVIAYLGVNSMIVVGLYLLFQVLYNAGGKNVPIMDVFLIASGFVLRAALGAAVIEVKMSAWLLLCTGALALMLGFAKRRHEFILQGERRSESRSSLAHYSRQALDALVIMTSCASALCYGIYALESPTAAKYPALLLTAVFVFYGICRYVFLVFAMDEGGEPETILFKDPHMIGSVVLFVAAAALAVSGVEIPLLQGLRP